MKFRKRMTPHMRRIPPLPGLEAAAGRGFRSVLTVNRHGRPMEMP